MSTGWFLPYRVNDVVTNESRHVRLFVSINDEVVDAEAFLIDLSHCSIVDEQPVS
jgi:hypothetical protein